MRVLVCGGRDFVDWMWLNAVLSKGHKAKPFTHIIHGGAHGADHLAGQWAQDNGLPVLIFPADWRKYGPAAGPIRNAQMLTEGKPDYVVGFPGGKGTKNMLALAKEAGIPLFISSERPKG